MHSPIRHLNLTYSPDGDITQLFGANQTLYAKFGLNGHNGIDIVRPHGEPLYAIEDGIIIAIENNPLGYGKNLRILSDAKEGEYHREWVYGHNSENLVAMGDRVKAGDLIAYMGNTGFTVSGSTPYWGVNPYAGTHVHLGLRLARLSDTGWSYSGSHIKIEVANYQNGYKGSIDPLPYLLQLESTAPEKNKTLWQKLLTIQSIINALRKTLS